ncbi:translation initiation factor IF-2-like [Orcinus orca]|uniref:translation initiation factor IF-2-like n=1 Tax=Orcinus orca TaxID=9733 RepID=UPI0021113F27|nr:translation initiation factor IF-2-like [Orcinus orca]
MNRRSRSALAAPSPAVPGPTGGQRGPGATEDTLRRAPGPPLPAWSDEEPEKKGRGETKRTEGLFFPQPRRGLQPTHQIHLKCKYKLPEQMLQHKTETHVLPGGKRTRGGAGGAGPGAPAPPAGRRTRRRPGPRPRPRGSPAHRSLRWAPRRQPSLPVLRVSQAAQHVQRVRDYFGG